MRYFALLLSLVFTGCDSIPHTQPVYSSTPKASGNPRANRSVAQSLEGCVLIADDGEMLGVITSNKYDSDSILNEYGMYGGKYSATSIWNEYGTYGGEYSQLSPFNQYSTTPPRIVTPEGQILGYLTVNKYKTPSISPYALRAILEE